MYVRYQALETAYLIRYSSSEACSMVSELKDKNNINKNCYECVSGYMRNSTVVSKFEEQ